MHNSSCLQGEVLDESTVKRLILLFEKRALKNQEMRIKFPDMPEKYVFLYNFILLSWILILFFEPFSWFVSSKSITCEVMYETLVSPHNYSQTKIIVNHI
jgi:hypothetical protein